MFGSGINFVELPSVGCKFRSAGGCIVVRRLPARPTTNPGATCDGATTSDPVTIFSTQLVLLSPFTFELWLPHHLQLPYFCACQCFDVNQVNAGAEMIYRYLYGIAISINLLKDHFTG